MKYAMPNSFSQNAIVGGEKNMRLMLPESFFKVLMPPINLWNRPHTIKIARVKWEDADSEAVKEENQHGSKSKNG